MPQLALCLFLHAHYHVKAAYDFNVYKCYIAKAMSSTSKFNSEIHKIFNKAGYGVELKGSRTS